MKKQLTAPFVLTALLFCSLLYAQPSFKKTAKFTFSAGIGTLPTFFNDGGVTHVPPVSFSLGYQVAKRFNLSSYIGYTSVTSRQRIFADGWATQIHNQSLMTGLRAQVQAPIFKKLEIYGGGFLGYNFSKTKEIDGLTGAVVFRDPNAPTPYDPNAPSGSLLYSGFLGGTYFIDKSFGIYGEAGYGISLLSLGFTLRL